MVYAGQYKSALVVAPAATAARRVNCKFGKIYYTLRVKTCRNRTHAAIEENACHKRKGPLLRRRNRRAAVEEQSCVLFYVVFFDQRLGEMQKKLSFTEI